MTEMGTAIEPTRSFDAAKVAVATRFTTGRVPHLDDELGRRREQYQLEARRQLALLFRRFSLVRSVVSPSVASRTGALAADVVVLTGRFHPSTVTATLASVSTALVAATRFFFENMGMERALESRH